MESREGRRPFREDRAKIYVYGDESSHTGHRYMAMGTLITGMSHDELEAELVKAKESHRLYDEVKWNKVPSQGKYLEGYQSLIKRFLALPVRFKVFIVDTSLYPLNHAGFCNGNEELGFYKYFYQLLYVGIIRQDSRPNYQVFLDPKTMQDTDSLWKLERCINLGAISDGFPDMWRSSCCVVEELSSPSACIQLTDLLTGMTAAKWNGLVKSASKLNFIHWAERQLGVDLSKPSRLYGNHKYNIWAFRPTAR